MFHRYIPLADWHRQRGQDLRPPSWRPPRFRSSFRLAAEDPDPGFTDWILKVAESLTRLDLETQKSLKRLGHPVKLLRVLAQKVDEFWFQHAKLTRLVDARGQAGEQLDDIVNTLSANLAISNEYMDVILEHADRAQSQEAQQALEQILDITHADEAVA